MALAGTNPWPKHIIFLWLPTLYVTSKCWQYLYVLCHSSTVNFALYFLHLHVVWSILLSSLANTTALLNACLTSDYSRCSRFPGKRRWPNKRYRIMSCRILARNWISRRWWSWLSSQLLKHYNELNKSVHAEEVQEGRESYLFVSLLQPLNVFSLRFASSVLTLS